MVKDSGFHRSIPVCSSGQSARATSLQAWLRNSCASERPWRSRLGQRPEVAPTARSISLEGIGFVLRLSPHRELSHDDATAVAHATPNVRFQVRRLRPSEVSSAPLASLRLTDGCLNRATQSSQRRRNSARPNAMKRIAFHPPLIDITPAPRPLADLCQ